ERIHRSNLIGMGVLPLQFPDGETADSLGLTGEETFSVEGVTELNEGRTPKTMKVTAVDADGKETSFDAVVRIDTPGERGYFRHGGIMQYVLRNLANA
ncbi:MAG: aconitate hydratase, partial [Propionibacterium sp.]|nr:aconitate hydratase [Propionibacterium sp.]